MNRIRIKTDFTVRWSILTRGEAASLEGRDLRLEMHTPAHVTMQVPFTVEDNVVEVRIAPELQTHAGVYSFTLWENHSKAGQTPLDKCSAFHLVSRTCKADASAADNIEVTPALDLGTDDMVFAPISLGGGSIEIDAELSLESENPVQNKAVTAGINEAKAAAQTAQNTADEAKTAAGTAEQNAKDYTNDQLGEYAKKTDIPSVPSKVSAFTNDAGYQKASDVQTAIAGKADTSDIPTKTSELTNDSGYITANDIPDVDTSTLATKTELSQGLAGKVDKVDGKQLSTEDFTTALKEKLAGLSNYDDTAITDAVASLQTQLNTLVSGDANTAIESFNEIIAFLNGIEDSESLDSIIASIEQQIAAKQDAIADLDTIRAGAAKGATALQEHQSLADYAKTADLAKVATSGSYEDLDDKPTIPDTSEFVTTETFNAAIGDINSILDNINGESA